MSGVPAAPFIDEGGMLSPPGDAHTHHEFETTAAPKANGSVNPARGVQQRVREFGRRISTGGYNHPRLQSVCGWRLAEQRAQGQAAETP